MTYTQVPVQMQTYAQPVQVVYQQPQMYTLQQQQMEVPQQQQAFKQNTSYFGTALLYFIGYIFPLIWMVQLFYIFSKDENTKLWGYRALSALLLYLVISFMTCYIVFQLDVEYCYTYLYSRN
ncbi:hypothetical protein EIN_429770 [Entamoeba invadens IP1]|uniref:Uncharacterized protein n=1 Tax=Entamoeba invadens IP1 TaxID=370355 RepID=A0A0A1UF14_ENTIV|nr:hypothetical protein EIN_429770 [Entamoeba invadens IP1]ELP95201.1 hypothetical protein EIN_429770 [Entamoeba invadens IP1]|eukprot:XP_004261972.1 hypothetical protein EIN_429770 [Entamoeba invadens IP1]